MAKQTEKLVHCRYPKCSKLHSSTELKKEDAIKGGKGSSYYHPDCYHTMQTVNQIKDLFYREINPTMTGKQIGQLVSIVNNIVFSKKVDVDFVKFALEYFIKYKPGALKFPGGMAYIIQDRDVVASWEREQQRKTKMEMQAALNRLGEETDEEIELDLEDNRFVYKPDNKSRFSSVLGV